MRKNLRADIELGAQIVIAVAVVVIAGVVVTRYLFSRQISPATLPRIAVGEHLSVPDVKWEENKKTLVFFLMKDCVYCASSAPFYRQLLEDAWKRNVKSLAILPNSIEEANAYVRSLDLPVGDVRTGSLFSYKITGTPTVLFVDEQGIVKSVWFGAAPPQREPQMREELVALFDREDPHDVSVKH